MAAYNADIQIGVKGVNQLRTLEQQLNRVSNSAKKISQTLQGLKVNQQTVKINTQGALTAIKNLEQRLNKLNKPVTVDVRYRETRRGSRSAQPTGNQSPTTVPQPSAPRVEVEANRKLAAIEARRKEVYGQLTEKIRQRNKLLEQQAKNIRDLQAAGQGSNARERFFSAEKVFGSKAGSKRSIGQAIDITGRQVVRQGNAINDLNIGIERTRSKYEALAKVSNGYYNQERRNILNNVNGMDLFDQKLDLIRKKKANRKNAFKGAGAAAAIGLSNVPGVGAVAQGAGVGAAVGGTAGAIAGGAVAGVVALAGATIQYADAAARASAEQLRFEQALQGITFGDDFAKALESVSELSDKFQQDIGDTTKQFTKLTAATTANGLSIKETEGVYKGLAAANLALGGDNERLQGILLATSQVFSKGKVQAEELRGQIGERLPGAFALFAKSMGKTPAELDKLLNDGKVTVEDFVNFTTSLFERFGDRSSEMIESPAFAGQRLEKALGDLQRNVGTLLSPIGAAFQDTFTGIVEAINAGIVALNNFLGIGTEGAINKTRAELESRKAEFERRGFTKETRAQDLSAGRGGDRQKFIQLTSDIAKGERKLAELEAKRQGLAPEAPTKPASLSPLPGAGKGKGATKKPAEPIDTTARTRVAIQLANELLRIEQEKFALLGEESTLKDIALKRDELEAKLANDLALIKQSNITAESKSAETELRRIEHQTDLAALANQEQQFKLEQTRAFEDQVTQLQRAVELESATSDEMRRQVEMKHALADIDPDLNAERKEELERLIKQRKQMADRNADPIFQYMNRLQESVNNTRGHIASLAGTIETELASAMSNAVTGLIEGTTTVQEAFSSMLKNIGKAFIDMAMKILAQKAILALMNMFFPGSSVGAGASAIGAVAGKALGGPVTPKKPYLVGETGPELFIPSESGIIGTNAMFDAAAGAIKSGSAVNINENSEDEDGNLPGSAFDAAAGAISSDRFMTVPRDADDDGGVNSAFAAASRALVNTNTTMQNSKVIEMQMAQNFAIENPEPIDVKFQSTVINNVSYVSQQEFQAGLAQAANRARSMTLKDLRQKPATRRSTGVA